MKTTFEIESNETLTERKITTALLCSPDDIGSVLVREVPSTGNLLEEAKGHIVDLMSRQDPEGAEYQSAEAFLARLKKLNL